MSKPWIHSQSSAKKFGGKPEDYIAVHEFMDCSKGAVSDNRHRVATHSSWFIMEVLPRVRFPNSCEMSNDFKFHTIINSDGKAVSIRDIGEQHVIEDYRNKYIPTLQDYVDHMELAPWMLNGISGFPNSYKKLDEFNKQKARTAEINSSQKIDLNNIRFD